MLLIFQWTISFLDRPLTVSFCRYLSFCLLSAARLSHSGSPFGNIRRFHRRRWSVDTVHRPYHHRSDHPPHRLVARSRRTTFVRHPMVDRNHVSTPTALLLLSWFLFTIHNTDPAKHSNDHCLVLDRSTDCIIYSTHLAKHNNDHCLILDRSSDCIIYSTHLANHKNDHCLVLDRTTDCIICCTHLAKHKNDHCLVLDRSTDFIIYSTHLANHKTNHCLELDRSTDVIYNTYLAKHNSVHSLVVDRSTDCTIHSIHLAKHNNGHWTVQICPYI